MRYYDPAMGTSVFAPDTGKPTAHPYGAWNLEAMDAHGGWLATATDLVRFAGALDANSSPALLRPESLEEMFASPTAAASAKDTNAKPRSPYYALGWNVVQFDAPGRRNSWHTGSLPGTSTILIRRHDGLQLAVLFNSRVSPHVDHLTRALDTPALHQAMDETKR